MLLALTTSAGVLTVFTWAYLLLARGRFWRIKSSVPPLPPTGETPASVAAIIPARNEAKFISASMSSLLSQVSVRQLHVFVVDDNSTDGTARIAREVAQAGSTARATVIDGQPLPWGWSGKLWAVEQGIASARAHGPEFFVLTDADIRHAPENVATLLAIAQSGGYDLVSLMVKLRCETVAEKLLIPAFVFFFFKLYPPAWVADPQRATSGAAGGCILVRREALERVGGIAAIRGAIIDDCALARAVKSSGGKLWLGLAPTTQSLRSYRSFAAIGRMIARTAFNQLRHSSLLLVAALLGLTVAYLLPPALLFTRRALPISLGAFAWAMMTVSYLPMIRFYRLNPLWALTLPAAAAFYMGATVVSAFRYWSGRGGEWKGRAQDRL